MILYCVDVMTRYTATRTRCPLSVSGVIALMMAVRMFAGMDEYMNRYDSWSTSVAGVAASKPSELVADRSTFSW